MRSIEVGDYRIMLDYGLLTDCGRYVQQGGFRRAAIVTDSNVESLYGKIVRDSLHQAGVECCILSVPPGENSKSHTLLIELYEKLCQQKISRHDVIIALGGGVVGDLAGYLAATYLRGIALIQMPTTLLAQVDSSVGGKVAINLPCGKNLVGAFYNPTCVLADLNTLRTLDRRQINCGLAEVIKYGCIARRELFELLEKAADLAALSAQLPEIVATCCELKRDYVLQDRLDQGRRQELNFGHTLGHALEQERGYGALGHGEAIACGMVWAARVGEHLGVTPVGTSNRIAALLDGYGLPKQCVQVDQEKLWQAMLNDKKSDGAAVELVLLAEVGRACSRRVTAQELRELLSLM